MNAMKRVTVASLLALTATSARAQVVKIVGIGASSCAVFNEEVARNPPAERDYVAWAQGFMSGALIRAPQGVDENLDLAPMTFPLRQQVEFLHTFCSQNPGQDYLNAVHALYRRLREAGA